MRRRSFSLVRKLPPEPPSSEITPPGAYSRRREFLKNAAGFAATATGLGGGLLMLIGSGRTGKGKKLAEAPGGSLSPASSSRPTYRLDEPLTPYEDVTSYNNFYEFGLGK